MGLSFVQFLEVSLFQDRFGALVDQMVKIGEESLVASVRDYQPPIRVRARVRVRVRMRVRVRVRRCETLNLSDTL